MRGQGERKRECTERTNAWNKPKKTEWKKKRESLLWRWTKMSPLFHRSWSGAKWGELNSVCSSSKPTQFIYRIVYGVSLSLLLLLLLFFTNIFLFVVWIPDSLAEHSVYRLAFNTLSSTISVPLFWSAGVDFCMFVYCVNVPKQTHPHTHRTPWKWITPPSALMHFLLHIHTMVTAYRVNLYSFVCVRLKPNRDPNIHFFAVVVIAQCKCMFVYLIHQMRTKQLCKFFQRKKTRTPHSLMKILYNQAYQLTDVV